jgi:hypothetical protein
MSTSNPQLVPSFHALPRPRRPVAILAVDNESVALQGEPGLAYVAGNALAAHYGDGRYRRQ